MTEKKFLGQCWGTLPVYYTGWMKTVPDFCILCQIKSKWYSSPSFLWCMCYTQPIHEGRTCSLHNNMPRVSLRDCNCHWSMASSPNVSFSYYMQRSVHTNAWETSYSSHWACTNTYTVPLWPPNHHMVGNKTYWWTGVYMYNPMMPVIWQTQYLITKLQHMIFSPTTM